jgi:hypothetical protein
MLALAIVCVPVCLGLVLFAAHKSKAARFKVKLGFGKLGLDIDIAKPGQRKPGDDQAQASQARRPLANIQLAQSGNPLPHHVGSPAHELRPRDPAD